MEHVHMCLKLE